MKIFQNKVPRSWKSSGISIKNNQIEMSNFSFMEDYFKIRESKFSISIIGKNIIGDGGFYISIYKNEFLVWKEFFNFKNISFSKKVVEIDEEPEAEFKIVISRGRESRGKILIDSISIFNKSDEKLKIKNKDLVQGSEDEPTFFLEEKKEETPIVIDSRTEYLESLEEKIECMVLKIDEDQSFTTNVISEEAAINTTDIDVVSTGDIPPITDDLLNDKAVESFAPQTKSIKKEKKNKVGLLKKRKVTKINADFIAGEEKSLNSEELLEKNIAFDEIKEEPKAKNNIWVHILDLSSIVEEREIFKYINQISFGRGKQTFLIKNNPEINLSKYDHVIICDNDGHIIIKLKDLNPNKITFSEANLSPSLLEEVQIIKNQA
jgi:hypothetical protein